jgi:hypothetical protein
MDFTEKSQNTSSIAVLYYFKGNQIQVPVVYAYPSACPFSKIPIFTPLI